MSKIEALCMIDSVALSGVREVRFSDAAGGIDGNYQRCVVITLDNGEVFQVKIMSKNKDNLMVKVQRPLHI